MHFSFLHHALEIGNSNREITVPTIGFHTPDDSILGLFHSGTGIGSWRSREASHHTISSSDPGFGEFQMANLFGERLDFSARVIRRWSDVLQSIFGASNCH
jgi:hypothetical protein